MPRHLAVGPELGHDLVEPDVGGLQGLVEHVETGGAHVSPPMIAPRFWSGNAWCRLQFRRVDAVSVSAEMFQRLGSRLKVPAGKPRRAADYPGAFSDWNFISSIGAYVCAASSSPLRRHGRSASPCDVFLLFLLADRGDDVHHPTPPAPPNPPTPLHP